MTDSPSPQPTPGNPDAEAMTLQVRDLARLLAQTESTAEGQAVLADLDEADWSLFDAGVFFGQAATVFTLQRHGLLPENGITGGGE